MCRGEVAPRACCTCISLCCACMSPARFGLGGEALAVWVGIQERRLVPYVLKATSRAGSVDSRETARHEIHTKLRCGFRPLPAKGSSPSDNRPFLCPTAHGRSEPSWTRSPRCFGAAEMLWLAQSADPTCSVTWPWPWVPPMPTCVRWVPGVPPSAPPAWAWRARTTSRMCRAASRDRYSRD